MKSRAARLQMQEVKTSRYGSRGSWVCGGCGGPPEEGERGLGEALPLGRALLRSSPTCPSVRFPLGPSARQVPRSSGFTAFKARAFSALPLHSCAS